MGVRLKPQRSWLCSLFVTQLIGLLLSGPGTHLAMGFHRVLAKCPPKSQVPDLDGPVQGEENVGRLEVPVHHTLLVHIVNCLAYLREVLPANTLIEVSVALLSLSDLPLEVACCRPLENYYERGSGNEGVEVLNDVRVRQGLREGSGVR